MDPKERGIEVMVFHNGLMIDYTMLKNFKTLDDMMDEVRRIVETELKS